MAPSRDGDMGRGKSWTSESDQALCLAWLHVMQDPQAGSPQGSITFWTRARSHYETSVDNTRTSRALQSRWSILSLAVRRFCQVYDEIRSSAESHETEGDMITSALKKYHLIHPKKEVFEFVGCWQVLRNAPPWIETCSKKFSSSGSSGTDMTSIPAQLEWKAEVGQEAGQEAGQDAAQETGQEAGQRAAELGAGSDARQDPASGLDVQPEAVQETAQRQVDPSHPASTQNGVFYTTISRGKEVLGSSQKKANATLGRQEAVQEKILAQLEKANQISEENLKVHKLHTYAFILSMPDDQIPATSKDFFNDTRAQIMDELRESPKESVRKRLSAARSSSDSKKKSYTR